MTFSFKGKIQSIRMVSVVAIHKLSRIIQEQRTLTPRFFFVIFYFSCYSCYFCLFFLQTVRVKLRNSYCTYPINLCVLKYNKQDKRKRNTNEIKKDDKR